MKTTILITLALLVGVGSQAGCGGVITGRVVKLDRGSVGGKRTVLACATVKAHFKDPKTGKARTTSVVTGLFGEFTICSLPEDTPIFLQVSRRIDNWHYWSWRKGELKVPGETGKLDLGKIEAGIQFPPTPAH